jgi:SAM-dependent methyltransferase
MSGINDWSAGYVSEIGYTYGYYAELNPLRTRLALLNRGIVPPTTGYACELGFGQGVSVGIHAAASPTQWYGTDFNHAQAAFAQELVEKSGSGAKLYDESFEEFCKRDDLPDFDYIGVHGIWSWISNENRAHIVDFLKRKLKVGGVLYISYNTLPGWAAFAPVQHLMSLHSDVLGVNGQGVVSRIEQALDFTDRLLATNPIFARANPQVAERLKKLRGQDKHYLAHEYFNRNWDSMHFATMAEWLQAAKLDFAGSAYYFDAVDRINLSGEQQALLRDIPDPTFAESVRDFMVNQQFRRDYWIKGARKLTRLEQLEQLGAVNVMLNVPREDASLSVTGSLGQADMNAKVYEPILDLLSDYQPRPLSEIAEVVLKHGFGLPHMVEMAMVLIGSGQLNVVQDAATVSACKPGTDKLNRHLMRRARSGGEVQVLASPVTGGGFSVGRFQQLFALAYSEGLPDAPQWAQYAWDILKAQGQRIARDGKPIETDAENLAELNMLAPAFKDKLLPILKALQIV